MIELNARVIVVELLKQQLEQLSEIITAITYGSLGVGIDNPKARAVAVFNRWSQRTLTLVSVYVSQAEVNSMGQLNIENITATAQNPLFSLKAASQLNIIAGHLSSLIESIISGSVAIDEGQVRKVNYRIVRELYDAYEKNRRYATSEALADALGIDRKEIWPYTDSLEKQNAIYRFRDGITLSVEAAREVKELVSGAIESYESKEFRVLKAVYDMSGPSHMDYVDIDALAKGVKLEFREIIKILNDLEERKGLITGFDQAVTLTSAGIEEYEATQRHPEKPTPNFPAYIGTQNNLYVNAPVNAIQQATQNSSQTVSVVYHQPISEVLPKLAELITEVKRKSFTDKEDVVRDLGEVYELAQAVRSESGWKRIQRKLQSAKLAMEDVGFLYHSLPYWPVIWDYFQQGYESVQHLLK